MRRLFLRVFVLAVTAATAGVSTAPAQDGEMEERGRAAEELAAYLAASTPGPEHERLAELVGSYTVAGRFWAEPGADPVTATHSSAMRMALGDRYLIEELDGELWGDEFHGMGITGYDNVDEKYVTVWIDNMSTGIFVLSGNYDRGADAIVMQGQYTDPVTGAQRSVKSVDRIAEGGERVYEHYEITDDGSEFRVMQLTYRRKPTPAAH